MFKLFLALCLFVVLESSGSNSIAYSRMPLQQNPHTFKELLNTYKGHKITLYFRSANVRQPDCKINYIGEDYVKIEVSKNMAFYPLASINSISTYKDESITIEIK